MHSKEVLLSHISSLSKRAMSELRYSSEPERKASQLAQVSHNEEGLIENSY